MIEKPKRVPERRQIEAEELRKLIQLGKVLADGIIHWHKEIGCNKEIAKAYLDQLDKVRKGGTDEDILKRA